MAQRYPGKMLPLVAPLACFPKLSFPKTLLVLGVITVISVFLGVHWLLVPGLYGAWILTAIPHAFSHLIADRIFKREVVTDWAGPIPNMIIVVVCYLSSVDLIGGFKTMGTQFGATISENPLVVIVTLLYTVNVWGVFQHLFLPWPANDPDVGLITKLFYKKS